MNTCFCPSFISLGNQLFLRATSVPRGLCQLGHIGLDGVSVLQEARGTCVRMSVLRSYVYVHMLMYTYVCTYVHVVDTHSIVYLRNTEILLFL